MLNVINDMLFVALILYSILSTCIVVYLYKGYNDLIDRLYKRINALNSEVFSLIAEYKGCITIGDRRRVERLGNDEQKN